MTVTVKISEDTMKEMNEFFDDFKREKTPPYALFQADDADCVVTVYESGKAVFQGKTADMSSQMWIEMEQHKNPNKKVDVKNSDNKKKEEKLKIDKNIYYSSSIGSDEVGTGDFFGPIVVTAAYVKKEDINDLIDLGIKDSKKLTDEQILNLVPKFLKKVSYQTYVMSAKEYNEVYNPETMNMNKIKAILHNKALIAMKEKEPNYDYIVVDQFAKDYTYYRYLKECPNVVRGIKFITKGEDHSIAVACASLISRYTFLKEFDKICEELQMYLPKGASNETDAAGVKLVNKYGLEKLNEVAKLNFKNTEKIKEIVKNS